MPKNSLLIKRINSLNKEYIMPPPDSKLMVSEYEKALIQKWINQGAEYKEHWSFIIPKKSIRYHIIQKINGFRMKLIILF